MSITESRLTVEGNGRSLTRMQSPTTPRRSTSGAFTSDTANSGTPDTSATSPSGAVAEGLQGIIATETRLSRVDGEAGRLTIAGYDVAALAPAVPFEAVAHLLLHDRLPGARELASFREQIAAQRGLGETTLELLRSAARQRAAPMHALRLGVASLTLAEVTPLRLLGAVPSIAAAYGRLLAGQEPRIDPSPRLSSSESFLQTLNGSAPTAAQARALDTYWNTVADHGLNASTFTARVIASTGSDLGSAIEGALGALQGPLHGGAPGPALEAFEQLRSGGGDLAQATRTWVEAELAGGRRIMGFGHRIYRVRDPRALVLERAAEELLAGSSLLAEARVHERAVLETLARLKPGRSIATNVEFYTALVLHGLGLPTPWFTPVFALGRLAGWLAHVAEQKARGRLIRPDSRYVGAEGRAVEAIG
jgi:citrate synthase